MPFLLLWHPRATGTPTPTPEVLVERAAPEGGGAKALLRRRRLLDEDDEDLMAIAGFALTVKRD